MQELLENAGIFAWPLGLCSLMATIIIIERLFALRASRIMPPRYMVAFTEGTIPESGDPDSVAGKILNFFRDGSLDAEQLKAFTRLQVTRMERGLFILEIVVSAARGICGGCFHGPDDDHSRAFHCHPSPCFQQLPQPPCGHLRGPVGGWSGAPCGDFEEQALSDR